ncbi:hypothetical protein JW899_01430 [Candidatus Uhrbacteria bacterium]|nr:hypothetical protein [Candidatus Uhrbacteria bacterium]
MSSFEIRYEMWNFEAYLFTAVISVVTGFTFGMLGSPVEYPIWTVTVSAAIFGLILVILIAIYGGRWIPAMEKREAEEKKKRE